jgi:WhiB family redox-sensing transcriptional regulator
VIGWCSKTMAEWGNAGGNNRVHADPTCWAGPDPMVPVNVENGLLLPSRRGSSAGVRVHWCLSCQRAAVPGEWASRAACRGADQDLFFPTEASSHENDRYSYREARAICKTCPVLDDCRGFALAREPGGGMWGGMSPKQRKEARLSASVVS